MTIRQQITADVARHLRKRNPANVTGQAIQEAITALGYDNDADGYDWTRLRKAVAREQFDKYTRANPASSVRTSHVPALR